MSATGSLSDKNLMRSRWPDGLMGWLGYLMDHKVRGFTRPVPWTDLWHLEHVGHGKLAFANGGCAVFDAHEVGIIKLLAKGKTDADTATEARASERAVRLVRKRLEVHLGALTPADIAAVASSNNLLS